MIGSKRRIPSNVEELRKIFKDHVFSIGTIENTLIYLRGKGELHRDQRVPSSEQIIKCARAEAILINAEDHNLKQHSFQSKYFIQSKNLAKLLEHFNISMDGQDFERAFAEFQESTNYY